MVDRKKDEKDQPKDKDERRPDVQPLDGDEPPPPPGGGQTGGGPNPPGGGGGSGGG